MNKKKEEKKNNLKINVISSDRPLIKKQEWHLIYNGALLNIYLSNNEEDIVIFSTLKSLKFS